MRWMREHLGFSSLDLGCFRGKPAAGKASQGRRTNRWLIKVVQAGAGGRKESG